MKKNCQDTDHDDLLERAIDSVVNEPVPEEPPPRHVTALVAKVQQAVDQPYPMTLPDRMRNMMTPAKLAIAASVLIVLSGLSWLSPSGGTVMAVDDVAEALRSVQSATWKKTSVVKGPDGKSTHWTGIGMYLAPSHERMEMTADEGTAKSALIVDGRKDHALVLDLAEKTAMVLQFQELPGQSPFGRSFQDLRKLIINAQEGKAAGVERLGVEIVDGRRVGGFRVQVGSIAMTLWADPETSLPVRVEYTTTTEPKVSQVLTDFQINVTLEKSLFSLEVPKDYAVDRKEIDVTKRPVDYLAEALRLAAEHNDNLFPSELRGKDGIDGVLQRAAAKIASGKTQAQRRDLASDLAMNLGGAFAVLFGLSPEHDLHYVGKDVKLDAPNKPILYLRIQPSKTSNYHVIYADLTIEEVPPEDAPKKTADNSAP